MKTNLYYLKIKMKITDLILFISIISFSVNLKEEGVDITNFEDLKTLVTSKDFQSMEQGEDEPNLKTLFGKDECLLSSDDAKTILKQQYGINSSFPDRNLRFIIGKCNPVLLIPGIYATKLMVELECKNIAQYEKTTTLKEIRIFCGDTVCGDTSKEREEHPLFIGLFDDAFTILGSKNDKYSSCLGYFMNHFQNENECPTVNGKKICKHSKYVKVGFFGGTTETKPKSRCGIEGIQNIIQSGSLPVDKIVNIGAARSYEQISNKLKDRGYEEGFSFAGLPNDYRRFLATNNFAKKVFRSQIERLYANTGKPVVVVGHSYGTLLTLTNLAREENKDLLPKIKKFVAIAPPFAGSSKLLDIFLHGLDDWNKSFDILGKKYIITNYNKFGQYMMYSTIPCITELRPLSIAAKIFTDSKYKELGDALRERIGYEKKCRNLNCNNESTPKFDKLFKGYFPSVTDTECAFENVSDKEKSLSRKCFTQIYNVGECPTILTTSSLGSNPFGNNVDSYCSDKRSIFYYQGECNNNNCLDNIYSQKGPYAYDNTEAVEYLLNRYNKDFAKSIDGVKITKSYFETKSQINEGHKKSIEYHDSISLIKDLPPPPIDTDLVYASFVKTPNAFVLYDKDFTEKGTNVYKGGDGTVPVWSSLLTGFKWLYEKQAKNLQPKYKLVEYCSRLAKSGKYTFDPNKEQNFIALGCSCLDSNNEYKDKTSSCEHASLISDDTFVEYLMSVVDDPKVQNTATSAKKVAAKNYNPDKDYGIICNNELKNILETAK